MAIASISDVASGLSASLRRPFFKVGAAAKAAGSFVSQWRVAGYPGAGSAPPAYTAGSGYTCSSATNGAMPYVNASIQNYLARLAASSSLAGTLILYDRLWSCSGMGFGAATYTVTTPGSLPARITDGGVGCEIWCEQFVAAGAATGTLTVNYLDTGGAAGAGVIPVVVSAPTASQVQLVPLAVGDTGVSQIVSAVNSATWTSGSFGITIAKRIAEIPLNVAGVANCLDWAGTALARIPSDACLMLLYQASTTTAANITGQYTIIDK